MQVADFPDMTVYVENQPIGRTDGKGRVLLDSLRAYERNSVSIDPKELPFEASLATREMVVTPAFTERTLITPPIGPPDNGLTYGQAAKAETEMRLAAKKLDRAGTKRVIHPNAAARTKSRLSHLITTAKKPAAAAK